MIAFTFHTAITPLPQPTQRHSLDIHQRKSITAFASCQYPSSNSSSSSNLIYLPNHARVIFTQILDFEGSEGSPLQNALGTAGNNLQRPQFSPQSSQTYIQPNPNHVNNQEISQHNNPPYSTSTNDTAQSGLHISMRHLSVIEKFLLLSIGSMTEHLHIVTGFPTKAQVLSEVIIEKNNISTSPSFTGYDHVSSIITQEIFGNVSSSSPYVWDSTFQPLIEAIHLVPSEKVLQRQVLLTNNPDHAPSIYAISWWHQNDPTNSGKGEKRGKVTIGDVPIWAKLTGQRTELFRELRAVYLIEGLEQLEKVFQCPSNHEKKPGLGGPQAGLWARHYCFYKNAVPFVTIFECLNPSLFS